MRQGNGAVDRRELAFNAVAGLLGGAIGWLPVEVASHGHSLVEVQTPWTLLTGFISMAIVAGMIGGLIVAAGEQRIELSAAVKRHFTRGFLICFPISLPGTYLSNRLFSAILAAGGWSAGQAGSQAYLEVARVIGWALMGVIVGVGVGLATFSPRNVVKGALGGLIGGFVGGLVFDPIGLLSSSGLLSRLIGFSVIGLAIGFFIGLVQQLTKMAWMVVEAGRLRGRQFRLDGATIGIGRAEENPIGLFGDPGVQPRHALIEHRGDSYTLRNMAVQAGTFINGGRVESTALRDGDLIRISGYELRFHTRNAAQGEAAAAARPAVMRSASVGDAPAASNGKSFLARANGEKLELRADAPTRIGRALDNDIVVNDASVSRHHAEIEQRNGAYRLRDLGSQNGTWIGESRVTEAALSGGEAVRLGDAAFTFHG